VRFPISMAWQMSGAPWATNRKTQHSRDQRDGKPGRTNLLGCHEFFQSPSELFQPSGDRRSQRRAVNSRTVKSLLVNSLGGWWPLRPVALVGAPEPDVAVAGEFHQASKHLPSRRRMPLRVTPAGGGRVQLDGRKHGPICVADAREQMPEC